MSENDSLRKTYLLVIERLRPRPFFGRFATLITTPIAWAIAFAQRVMGGRAVHPYANCVHVGLANGSFLDPVGIDVIESTHDEDASGNSGVQKRSLFRTLHRYERGKFRIYLVPVAVPAAGDAMWAQAEKFVGREYDVLGALRAGIDGFEGIGIGDADGDAQRLFCSEMVAAAAVLGWLPKASPREWVRAFFFDPKRPSEQTPADVCSWPVWAWRDKINALTLFR